MCVCVCVCDSCGVIGGSKEWEIFSTSVTSVSVHNIRKKVNESKKLILILEMTGTIFTSAAVAITTISIFFIFL